MNEEFIHEVEYREFDRRNRMMVNQWVGATLLGIASGIALAYGLLVGSLAVAGYGVGLAGVGLWLGLTRLKDDV